MYEYINLFESEHNNVDARFRNHSTYNIIIWTKIELNGFPR